MNTRRWLTPQSLDIPLVHQREAIGRSLVCQLTDGTCWSSLLRAEVRPTSLRGVGAICSSWRELRLTLLVREAFRPHAPTLSKRLLIGFSRASVLTVWEYEEGVAFLVFLPF